ncbi:MAG: site-specific integrase [Paludibacter sp.]
MSYFKLVLDKRVKRKNGAFDLCVRYNKKNDVMYLKIIELEESAYNHVFVVNSMDEKSIDFREKCAGYVTKCERIYNQMKYFDKTDFRRIFSSKHEDKQVEEVNQNLKLSEMFKEYVAVKRLKNKTKEHYQTTINILETYKKDICVQDITPDFLMDFSEFKMKTKGCSQATVNSYARNLRAVINYYLKVKGGLPSDYIYPFGNGKFIVSSFFPTKEVISDKEIQSIVDFNDFETKEQEYARDIWLTLYRLNGINFADLLRMKRSDIKGRFITFIRKKTETTRKNNIKPIVIPYNDKVKEVIERIEVKDNPYLLGKLEDGYSEVTFDNISGKFKQKINRSLEFLTVKLKLSVPLKLGTARDCYATTLYRADTPIEHISDMLGHSNVIVTSHYLGSRSDDSTFGINNPIM